MPAVDLVKVELIDKDVHRLFDEERPCGLRISMVTRRTASRNTTFVGFNSSYLCVNHYFTSFEHDADDELFCRFKRKPRWPSFLAE